MSLMDLPLFPEDEGVTPEQEVDAAAAAAVDASDPEPLVADTVEPFGRTPLFDFREGVMVRVGSRRRTTLLVPAPEVTPSPDLELGRVLGQSDPGEVVWVTGLRALEQWCLMAIYSARYAHPVFSENFGMESPESGIGELVDVGEFISDYGDRLTEALLVHERIAAVENIEGSFDEEEQTILITFEVVTDEEERLSIGPLTLEMNRG